MYKKPFLDPAPRKRLQGIPSSPSHPIILQKKGKTKQTHNTHHEISASRVYSLSGGHPVRPIPVFFREFNTTSVVHPIGN